MSRPEADPSAATYRLLNDQPERGGAARDILGTHDAASRLAKLIEDSRDSTPFTVGIDAGWGMGKSSLMLQVQEQLRANPESGIEPVWFNAWTAEGTSALDGLIKSVLMSLDENVLRRGLRKILSRQQLMSGIRIVFIIAASYFHLTRVADEIWNRLSVDARSRNSIREQMAGMFEQWTRQTKRSPHGRTLVVFIDDLDRCSNDVILEVCEAMKLYLDVEGIAFVVGCDQAVLGQAALSAGRQSQNVANASYLEKIIQVTYTKPLPFQDQIEQLVGELAVRSGTASFFSDSVTRIVVDRTGRNPRRIKRLINSFVLEYRLDPGWEEFGAEALIIIIVIRQFYADFYHVIADPAAQDIAQEFLQYQEIRKHFQSGSEPTEEERQYYRAHDVRVPGSQYEAEDLTRLEDVLPVAFPHQARDADLASLLRSLSGREDYGRLSDRLRGHPIGAVTAQEILPNAAHSDERHDVLNGLHVLWIDDNPSSIEGERAQILDMGATVDLAATAEEARQLISLHPPDVLISDISRAGNSSAGLEDLAAMRADGAYRGPAIFYTARVTPARQRQAEALNAKITTGPSTLIELLREVTGSAPDAILLSTSIPRQPDQHDDADMETPTRNTRDRARDWLSGTS
jgi:CheY-like chemotaxis protein